MSFFFFFFMKGLKILIVKVAEFGNPSTKNIDRGTLLRVLKYFKGPYADHILIPQGSSGSSTFFDIK